MKNSRQKVEDRRQLTKKPFVVALKKWLKKNRAALIIFTIYLVVTFVAVLFHENWEDEAQAWLTARDCTPIELIERMGIEGHFMPWYLILMPFAKLGFPYRTMNIISWLITASAAWLMLKHLPCKFYKRVIFIFMLPMIYLYPVISRCYCLLPLGTILAIMFYKDRFKKPLRYLFSILIIANVHTYMLGFVLVLGMEYLADWIVVRKNLDKQQNARIMAGAVSIIILAGLSCLPLVGSVGATTQSTSGLKLLSYQNPLKQLFIYTPMRFFAYFSSFLPTLGYITASFLIVWEFFTHKKEFCKIFFAILWQCMICCFIFNTILPQRAMMIPFIILFFVSCRKWRGAEKGLFSETARKIPNILINLVFVFITIWIEIDTGNKNLAFLPLFSIGLFLLSVLSQRKKTKKILKVGQKVAKISLVFLVLLNVQIGFDWVKNEIKKPYTDALATAEFINKSLGDNDIFLTLQESSMPFTAITPYLNSQDNRFYSIRYQTFYTFTIQPTPSGAQLDFSDVVWNRYCVFGSNLYYVGESKQYYGENIFDKEKPTAPTADLEKSGILEEIFDIHEGFASTEHYTIYKINSDICLSESQK